jgi:hypothetical protein
MAEGRRLEAATTRIEAFMVDRLGIVQVEIKQRVASDGLVCEMV